jgi:LmbE family N-acetylglucosaminyl deacetylase
VSAKRAKAEPAKPEKPAKPAKRAAALDALTAPATAEYERDASIKKVLVVTAHPDDVDFGMAGTVATLTSEGVDVAYCLVTSGDAGGDALVMERADRAKLRESEQRTAASFLGVTDVTFLGYPDGLVEPTLGLRRDLARVIRSFRPDVVITQNPERNYERIYASHPDHLATGEATLRAVYPDARNPHAFPALANDEGLAPHTVRQVWIGGTNTPTMVVDITDAIDKKIQALKSHQSQLQDRDGVDKLLREWGEAVARTAGLPKGRYAEAFRVLDTA